MDKIRFSENSHITVEQINMLTANVSFYHVDRIAAMNVFIYVLSGCINVTEEDTDYSVQSGEMLLLKKGTHQYGKYEIKAGTCWIYAHFQISPEIDEGPDTSENKTIFLPKYVNLSGRNDVKRRIHELYEMSEKGKFFCKSRVALGLQELLLDLYEQEASLQNKEVPKDLPQRVKAFVGQRIHEDISSNLLEGEFHLTYKHLNRQFKLAEGKSIMQYHNELRLEAAAKELRTTNKSISSVANSFGFEDPLYFSKCFKKLLKVSPSKYRQEAVKSF